MSQHYRVAADILARLHFSLAPKPAALVGHASKGYASCLSRMRGRGLISGATVTREGYLYLDALLRNLRYQGGAK